MDPTNRRLELLALLQARPEWSGTELAERLAVSARTLRRDIGRLRDLGYAVDSATGTEGGYRLGHGRALPPLALVDAEAVAVAVGLRMAATSGVAGLDDAVTSAIAKLETALPPRLRQQVSALGQDPLRLGGHGAQEVVADTLVALALAVRRTERLRIAYRDGAGRRTRRDLDPHRLVRTDTHWYLVARDVAKDDWRVLRVDRVSDPRPLGVRFHLHDPPDAAELVSQALEFGPHENRALVRLDVSLDRARRLAPSVAGRMTADGTSTLVGLSDDDPWWTARFLLSLACPFAVIEGPALLTELHRLGKELAALQPGTSTTPAPSH
ncbi:WYL domain-containing protein [Actinomadura sp. 7K507]|uniref:helix-turn-helix transcriptional regulator n=1 Tax=Actinomadura sp. 7K507 TaxID=2530365 RepID=UPI001048B089|nr:WYL domain-containing protein [Actinomadura sp. 7K507]TDC79300.1 WYL domain-containing protein [Actinomadura sp. 7K507]